LASAKGWGAGGGGRWESPVVLSSDAVVQPLAMMVEVADTFVARSTVLTPFLHMGLAVAAIQ
jgi:hypothetical protein